MKPRQAPKSKRKRAIALLCCVLLCVLLLCANGVQKSEASAGAADEAAVEELYKNIDELLGSLNTDELQRYLDSLSEFGDTDAKERIKSLITGDYALEYDSLFEAALGFVWQEGKVMLPAFAVILAVALLCGILNSAKNSFMNSTMSGIINFVGYLAAGAAVLACLIGVLQTTFSAIENIRKQMEIVYPLLLTLMAASGGAVSVGVFRPAVTFLSGGITELFTTVVMPTSIAVIVLAFIGNLSEDVRTEKLGELFKSVNKWLIGLTLTIFGIFLTVQGIASAQYDGLSLRAAKYVVSGSVPLVGGFLSGGLELVVAGSALIKNALGSFAIFLLAGTVLRSVLLFAAFQLFLRLSAAATEPIGGKISGFLSGLAGNCNYFLAGLLCVAFLYFLTIVLLICSTGVFF